MNGITLIIIITTVIISIIAWRRHDLFYKLLLWPYNIVREKQYYRMLTHGFVHANWSHLLINMLVFWSFGDALFTYFKYIWGNFAILLFLLLYLSAIVVSSIYSVFKNKNNYGYTAVGASGATSAIIFAYVFFDPWRELLFFFIPIPGIIYGALFLIYSYIMGRRSADNIGHDAHFWGAIYGFIFPLILKPDLFQLFIQKLIKMF